MSRAYNKETKATGHKNISYELGIICIIGEQERARQAPGCCRWFACREGRCETKFNTGNHTGIAAFRPLNCIQCLVRRSLGSIAA